MLMGASSRRQRSASLADKDGYHRPVKRNTRMCKPVANGLRFALKCVIADNQRSDGPEIELCDDLGSDDLRPVLQVPVLCIVRELLLNACYHSKSRRILVGIAQDDAQVYIQVQDWGVGFNATAVFPNRHGLKTVRELVQWFGGTVEIDTQIGNGTCIVVEIPVHRENGQVASVSRDQGRFSSLVRKSQQQEGPKRCPVTRLTTPNLLQS